MSTVKNIRTPADDGESDPLLRLETASDSSWLVYTTSDKAQEATVVVEQRKGSHHRLDGSKHPTAVRERSTSTAATTSMSSTSSSSIRSLMPPFSSPSSTSSSSWNVRQLDQNALAFGTRMSVCITMASLFTLIGDPITGVTYPQGMWVIITVLFVCWFPSLDAASVVEKSIQRIYGTLIGASVGLVCGFASLLLCYQSPPSSSSTLSYSTKYYYDKRMQAIFVGLCIGIYTFVICWAANQFHVRGSNTKIIDRYNYACILCLLTFYICILPFYMDQGDKRWETSLYRVLNVLIGCIMGAALSVFILPRSTVEILQRKIESQIRLAGQASMAVLHHAADHFSETAYIPRTFVDELLETPLERTRLSETMRAKLSESHRPWRRERGDMDVAADEALHKHETAIHESRLIQAQLNMLKYDPFQLNAPDEVVEKFRTEVAHTLARALRIQHTVVLIDGIVRNDPKHDFGEEHISLFANVGSLIGKMLSVPLNEAAARELQAKMLQIRGFIVELASVVSISSLEGMSELQPIDRRYGKGGSMGVRIVGSRHDMMSMWNDSDESDKNNHNNNNWNTKSTTTTEWDDAEAATEEAISDDKGGKGSPKLVRGSRVCALLFLQLVEHLALRSLRLYESWKYCELLYKHGFELQHEDSPRLIQQSIRTLHRKSRVG
ncbi:hypothetical protein ACA910_017100 [Epithemia clementina (nom. ined.)]